MRGYLSLAVHMQIPAREVEMVVEVQNKRIFVDRTSPRRLFVRINAICSSENYNDW